MDPEGRSSRRAAKHIAVITSVHSPLDQRLRKQYRTLRQAGFRVSVAGPCDADRVVDGAQIHAIARPASRRQRMSDTPRHLWRVVQRLAPQAVHFHDPELLPLALMLAAEGMPVVYDRHEDAPRDMLVTKDYLPPIVRYVASGVVRGLEWLGALGFAAVVPATAQMAKDFPLARRVVPVRNFPDLDAFVHPPASSRSRVRFAYVGSIAPLRGITQIVDAMALLPNVCDAELVLYGIVDPPAYLMELQARPGWRRCRYEGVLDSTEVAPVLGQVDVGLACLLPVPTHLETVPTKVYEYLAAGLPVVASDFPYHRRVLDQGCGLLVDPTEPAAIASAMEQLARSPELRQRLGKTSRRLAPAYAWKSEGERLVAMYDDIFFGGRTWGEA